MKKTAAILASSLALIASVSAYSRAAIDSSTNVTSVKTDSAILALTPGKDADGTAYINAQGVMVVDFNKSIAGKGEQPNSHYAWQHLFTVTNNSNNAVNLGATLTNAAGATTDINNAVSHIKAGGAAADCSDGTELKGGTTVSLAAGASTPICLVVEPKDDSLGQAMSGTLTINATAPEVL